MSRTESLERWKRIADGDLEREQYDAIDLHAWIRAVAVKLLEADQEPNPTKRRAALIDAISMSGREDQYAALRALISEPIWDFPTLDRTTGQWHEDSIADLVRGVIKEARKRKLLRGSYDTELKKAAELIRGLIMEARQPK